MSDKLEQAGCRFKKKPDEGRMKGLAFVYDPDGYWVELVKRGDKASFTNNFNFSCHISLFGYPNHLNTKEAISQ